MNDLDWNDLRTLLAVQRTGSAGGAAVALGVARTTVSRRLSSLEAAAGVLLVERRPEGMVLTPAARLLVEPVASFESALLEARGRMLATERLAGPLRVSTVGFLYQGFAKVFESFVARYDEIVLTVATGVQTASLLRREADVVLRVGNAPAEHLWGRKIARIEFELYASRDLAARVGLGSPLDAWPWLHWDEQLDGRWLDVWLAEHAPGARVVLRSNDYDVLRRSILDGVGVLFLPCFDGDRQPDLVRVGTRLEGHGRDLWLLTLPELAQQPRVRAFLDHAWEHLVGEREAMAG